VELLGSLGSIATANNYANSATISTADGVLRDPPLNFFMERYTESYAAEITAFVAAIGDAAPVPVTGWDGRVPVVMGLAARRSIDEGRPVRLEEFAAPSAVVR
jgi:myo-inositol 2-dehydrogenase/D-chiro-inositol 1-dehydrogenase